MSADPTSPGADSYPRESARTQRYTLGEPRDVVVSPDGERIVFLRSRGGDRSGQLPVGRRRRDGRGAPRRRPRSAARRATTTRSCRPRRRPAASGLARAPAASPRSPRIATGGSPPSPSPGGCSSAGWCRARRASCRSPARCSTLARTRWPSASPTSAGVCCASGSSTDRGACWPAARTTSGSRSRGAAPTSSPPRRWAASAATGGARTAPPWPSPASTRRRCSAGTSATRLTPPASHASCRIRRPGRQRRGHPARHRVSTARSSTSSGIGTSFPYLADVRWSDAGLIATVQSRDQRAVHVLRVDPDTGRHRGRLRGPRRRLGRTRRRACPGCCPTAPSSRAPTGTAPAGCWWAASRSRRPTSRCAPSPPSAPTPSRSPPTPIDDPTSIQVWQRDADGALRALTDEPGVHGVAVGGGTRRSCARRRSPNPARSGRRSTASSWPATPPCRRCAPTSTSRSPARAASPRPCCSPTTTTARRLPGAARPVRRTARPTASCRPTTPTWRRSGSPTRASPSSSPTVAAPPGGAPSGSAPCTSTSPTPVLEDQVDRAARTPPSSTRST